MSALGPIRPFPLARPAGRIERASESHPNGGAMPYKNPWYSTKTRDKHHNNSNCNTGNNIEQEYIAQGTGGLPFCQECAKLNSEGK
jgi:hypothetical protein